MAEDHGHDEHGGGGGEGGEHKAHKSHGSHGPGHGGGHEEHAGAPEWLISFADNVALLMGFFVILLAMNMGPKAKQTGMPGEGPGGHQSEPGDFTEQQANMIELQWGILEAVHSKPSPHSRRPEDRKLYEDYQKLQEQKNRNRGGAGADKGNVADPHDRQITPNLVVEFDDGTASLSLAARQLIREIVTHELNGKDWIIDVIGHVSAVEAKNAERAERERTDGSTDEGAARLLSANQEEGSGAGFELSYQRAYAVAVEMARAGMPWKRIRIVAWSDMKRTVARVGEDPTKNRKNQRVEIMQTKDQVKSDYASVEPGSSR